METCTDCGAPATCEYDYGTGLRKACASHDPLNPLIAATARVPPFYQTIPRFPVPVTHGPGYLTPQFPGYWQPGQVGISPGCTCGAWNSVTPPPPCPAHGQSQMVQVTC